MEEGHGKESGVFTSNCTSCVIKLISILLYPPLQITIPHTCINLLDECTLIFRRDEVRYVNKTTNGNTSRFGGGRWYRGC